MAKLASILDGKALLAVMASAALFSLVKLLHADRSQSARRCRSNLEHAAVAAFAVWLFAINVCFVGELDFAGTVVAGLEINVRRQFHFC